MNSFIKMFVILMVSVFTSLAHGKPVILACEMEFTGCVKELDGRKVCAPPRLRKNTIEVDAGSIRHLDDYGYFGYEDCEVSETMISCAEDPEPAAPSVTLRSTRRLTIERATGRIDSSIDAELGARIGVSSKVKGWLNKYTGYCTVRENKNLF